MVFFFYVYVDHRKLHRPTHAFSTRRSADLLKVSLLDEVSGERDAWYYEDGLPDYRRSQLTGASPGRELLPAELFTGAIARETEAVDWALCWLPEADGGEMVQEAYVNLIPKIGRAHV